MKIAQLGEGLWPYESPRTTHPLRPLLILIAQGERDAMAIAPRWPLRRCAPRVCHVCRAQLAADMGLDPLGRRMHTAAAGRRRLQTRGTRTSGHMSRRPPAHDNPVARKEVEVGAGAGHPARARSGRLFTGESAETSAIQSKRSQRKKKTAVWSARAVPHPGLLYSIALHSD
jgi:hypothetical protein